MKKSFSKLDKIQIVIGITALILAILGFIYVNLTEIALILLSINLLVNGIRYVSKDKKSISTYLLIGIATLFLFLSIHNLLY